MSHGASSVCGGCRRPLYLHRHVADGFRVYLFCNQDTSDEFTNVPRRDDILCIIENGWPDVYAAALKRWKIENGHEAPDV